MKETSYNKKGTFNISVLSATIIKCVAPNSSDELGALLI